MSFALINSFRTGQEEMRTYAKNNTDGASTKAEPTHKHSFTLSTETCMIIHGIILATLFTVAISRYFVLV